VKKELHDILLKFDLPEFECPPDFDGTAAMSLVRRIQPELEAVLSLPLELNSNVQDASYFTELEVVEPAPGLPQGRTKRLTTRLSIRFSCFGRMATVCDWGQGIEAVRLSALGDLLSAHGFVYVPEAALQEKYDGRAWPGQGPPTWFRRYFDYS
jgi:hypothetical protein